jgi:hypothetical protein
MNLKPYYMLFNKINDEDRAGRRVVKAVKTSKVEALSPPWRIHESMDGS